MQSFAEELTPTMSGLETSNCKTGRRILEASKNATERTILFTFAAKSASRMQQNQRSELAEVAGQKKGNGAIVNTPQLRH